MNWFNVRLTILAVAIASLVAVALPVRALADTFGLLPPTPFELELRLPKAPEGAPAVMAFRTTDEFKTFLKSETPDLSFMIAFDFEKFMLVGITRKIGENLVIYRVEVDDAAKPTVLLVRVALDDAPSISKPSEIQLVMIPVSALPIRFVRDEMVDGGIAAMYPDGVDSKVLSNVGAIAATGLKEGPAVYREQAEQLARATLSAAEVKQAKEKILPGFGDRYPQPYSKIEVHLFQGVWKIRYDDFQFEVDAAGKVTRIKHYRKNNEHDNQVYKYCAKTEPIGLPSVQIHVDSLLKSPPREEDNWPTILLIDCLNATLGVAIFKYTWMRIGGQEDPDRYHHHDGGAQV